MKKHLFLFIALLLVVSACKNKKSEEPVIQEVITPEVVEEDTLSVEVDTTAVEVESIDEKEDFIFEDSSVAAVPADMNKYFLICGSFISYENAQRFQQNLISQGYQSEIIERPEGPNGQFYKVSYMGFSSWNKAVERYRSDKYQDGNEDIWILVNN